jgi:glutamyl/glutaminyl-tRNA synthetase
MVDERRRKEKVNQYQAYASILEEKGVSYEPYTHEELEAMTYAELTDALREVTRLARTPT